MENTEVTKIPFEVNRIPDGDKPVGEEVVVQDGVDGTRTVVTVDGHITSDRTVAPKNAVIYYGTKEVPNIDTIEDEEYEVVSKPISEEKSDSGMESQLDNTEIMANLRTQKTMNRNALVVRAFKTFVQAGLATWAVTNFDFTTGAIVGAIAAGISALMNLFIQPVEAK